MKYAFKYYNRCPLDKASEIIVKYTEKEPNLINYVKTSKVKVVADVTQYKNLEDSINIFEACFNITNKFTLKISLSQSNFIPLLMEKNINFFFAEGADTWDKLHSYILKGVSEVYIINELGFDIIRVSDVCKKFDVKIRVYPNVAQTSALDSESLDTFKFFYIRPEDAELYKEYVDTFEFYGPVDRQEVLYKIYEINKEWPDNLSILIIGLKSNVVSSTINPALGGRRLSCKKKCNAFECIACDNALHLAKELADMNIVFKESTNEETGGHEDFKKALTDESTGNL